MNNKQKNSIAAAGIAGAIIGAGATAAAIALKDEKNRKKVTATIKDMGKKAQDLMGDSKKTSEEMVEKSKKVVEETKEGLDEVTPKTEHPIER